MPIPGFSLITPPEIISSAIAVEMVMERFKSSACAEAEAGAWLSEQVRHGKLKLLWNDRNPENPYGKALYLTGEEEDQTQIYLSEIWTLYSYSSPLHLEPPL